jgi:hypothetical protein
MLNRLTTTLIVAAAFVASFAGVSYAQGAVTNPDANPLEMLRPIYDAVAHGNYWLGGSLALVALCTAARKWGVKYIHALATDVGATVLVLLASFGTAFAASAAAGDVTPATAWLAVKWAVGAAGGWALISKLVANPLLNSTWFQTKAPAWMQLAARGVLWIFTKPAEVKAIEAQRAGDAAVAAKPAAGLAGVVGAATDVR